MKSDAYRLFWIDYAKVLLIYLVVVAHTSQITPTVDVLICGFHMPAFFIISGFLHRFSNSVKKTFVKSFQRLIVPALFFTTLNYIIFLLRYVLKNGWYTCDCLIKPLLGLIIYDRSISTPICGVIWFLVVLFLAKIFMESINKLCKNQLIVFAFICIVVIILNFIKADFGILYYFQRLLVALPFIFIGFWLKQSIENRQISKKVVCWGGGLLIITYCVLAMWNGRVGIHSFLFGHNTYCFYLIAILGSIGFLYA